LVERTTTELIALGENADVKITSYHCRLFFELERQRVENQTKIFTALRESVSGRPFTFSKWARIVTARHMNIPLSTVGSVGGVGGRFNYGKDINKTQFQPFNALYIAETHDVALCEKYGFTSELSSEFSNQQLGLGPSSHNYIRIKGEVHSVIDIRKAKSLRKFVNIIKHFVMMRRPLNLQQLLA